MKLLKKFGIAIVIMSLIALMFPAFTQSVKATDVVNNKTNVVHVHKVLLGDTGAKSDKFPGTSGLDDTEYTGGKIDNLTAYFGDASEEIANVYFAVKSEDGKYIATDGSKKDAGFTLTKENKGEILHVITLADGEGGILDTSNLPQDVLTKYILEEIPYLSTYVGADGKVLTGAKAVPVDLILPFTNNEGIQDTVHIYPKNMSDKPQIDKNFVKNSGLEGADNNGAVYANSAAEKSTASAKLGDTVPFEVKTKLPINSKLATIRLEDTMTKGLTFSKDLIITANKLKDTGELLDTDPEVTLTDADYHVVQNASGFVLNFTEVGLAKINAATKANEVEILVKYNAVVNNSAVVDTTDANNVRLEYSNRPKEAVKERPHDPISNKTSIQVDKTWDNPAENTEVVYYLYEAGATADADKVVDTVKKQGPDYNYTFTNLDASKTYYVKELVSGYNPTYAVDGDGVNVTNTKDTENPKPIEPTSPKVVTHGKKFIKTDNGSLDAAKRLQGANFLIKKDGQYLALKNNDLTALTDAKTALDNAITAYNALTEEEQAGTTGSEKKVAVAEKQKLYDAAFISAKTAYEWVTSKTAANLVRLVSDADGKFEITGLAAGNYALEEVVSPKGYVGSKDDIAFVVAQGSYTGDESEMTYNADGTETNGKGQRVINKKITIPFTGGIGTTVFIVAGASLMGLAIFAMKRRKRQRQ